jgi:hypothetical protein
MNTITIQELQDQNRRFKGTGGVSQENRSYHFLPAFLDTQTGAIYLSRFADGRIAPLHLLDGLPPELVVEKTVSRKLMAAKDSVTAGFLHCGRFYTRGQAAKAVKEDRVCEG